MIVKSKHGLRTCSSRRFQWYPTTYMCWAMTKPLLWIKLILSHSKGWVGLKTYRLWGIIGIVLMSTCLIHGYFLRSRHFAKPCLFSREISTVALLQKWITNDWVHASESNPKLMSSHNISSILFPFFLYQISCCYEVTVVKFRENWQKLNALAH